MATQNPHHYNITNGPGKFDLMLGLMDNTATNTRHTEFRLELAEPASGVRIKRGNCQRLDIQNTTANCQVSINGLQREDGSGHKWLFEGYLTSLAHQNEAKHIRVQRVHGYFDTNTRKGWVEFAQ